MNLVALEDVQHLRQVQIPLNVTAKQMIAYRPLVFNIHVIPTGEHTHHRAQIRTVEMKQTILPGNDSVSIYILYYMETGAIRLSLLTRFQYGVCIAARYL